MSSRSTVRLTMAQALIQMMCAQKIEVGQETKPIFAGVWAIFGHGNVAGIGEALYSARETLPTLRGHNEQSMALAAIAFAKASGRRRMMACTTSIGPGATNLVTAAAVAHVNRLPILLLPGDVFASRRPDPVLQQVEAFGDGTVSANDTLRPVSRYFDRIVRPEQIITAFERAMQVLTDPAECGPVTLALCQDVQAESHDFPQSLFEERVWSIRRIGADHQEIGAAAAALRASAKPIIIAGGGIHYSAAGPALGSFCERHAVPVVETQAGKGALPHDHPLNAGAVGVTGTSAANCLAREADVVLAVGTRLQDFTTGSWTLFQNPTCRFIGLNCQPFDAGKHRALPLVADASRGLEDLSKDLRDWRTGADWQNKVSSEVAHWKSEVASARSKVVNALPSDADVIWAIEQCRQPKDTIICAAGGLPGELHKLWNATDPLGYHAEYGYSCMGYEIAGGLGVKLALPDREVIVMVGDGSYLMANSELATSVALGAKIIVVLIDNGGFGCINRLQQACGGAPFNNLLRGSATGGRQIDFAAHASSLGAVVTRISSAGEIPMALAAARAAPVTAVILIEADPSRTSGIGGHWWDVAVPEVSTQKEVREAFSDYKAYRAKQGSAE